MDGQGSPALDFGHFKLPSVDAIHFGRARRRHAPNGVANRAFAGDVEAHAAVDRHVLYARGETPPRQHVVLLADPLLGPLDRDRMIARIGFHPALIVVRPLAQHLLADLGDTDDTDDVAEEVHHQLRSRERRQIAEHKKTSDRMAASAPPISAMRKTSAIAYSKVKPGGGNVAVIRHQAYSAMKARLIAIMTGRLVVVGFGQTAAAMRKRPKATIAGLSAERRASSAMLETSTVSKYGGLE